MYHIIYTTSSLAIFPHVFSEIVIILPVFPVGYESYMADKRLRIGIEIQTSIWKNDLAVIDVYERCSWCLSAENKEQSNPPTTSMYAIYVDLKSGVCGMNSEKESHTNLFGVCSFCETNHALENSLGRSITLEEVKINS